MRTYAFALLVLAGCSSSGPSGPPPRSYTDQSGRQCTTNGNGPSACDANPTPSDACTVDYPTPCWDLFPTDTGGQNLIENCAACCNATEGAASASPADCTPIVCQSPADCPFDFDTCVNGLCGAN